MKTLQYFALLSLIFIFSCQQNQQTGENTIADNNINTTNAVKVDDILDAPDQYAEKEILISGLVTHVCKHSGKRLHLTSPETNVMIRVEATGDINQFERELEGNEITVKGIFRKQVIDEDYLAKWENENPAGEGMHEEHNEMEEEENTEQINNMRKRLEESGEDRLISYWLDGTSFKEN